MNMSNIKIIKKIENDYGWLFTVQLKVKDTITDHLVSVPLTTYRELTGGKTDPDELVIKSFEFLLEHESPKSILPEFELDTIGTYYDDWWQAMVKQLS